jgi:hypothetical protein
MIYTDHMYIRYNNNEHNNNYYVVILILKSVSHIRIPSSFGFNNITTQNFLSLLEPDLKLFLYYFRDGKIVLKTSEPISLILLPLLCIRFFFLSSVPAYFIIGLRATVKRMNKIKILIELLYLLTTYNRVFIHQLMVTRLFKEFLAL